jgi:hypothetical protein
MDSITKVTDRLSTLQLLSNNVVYQVILLVVALLLALAWCFFGYKAMKPISSIVAFFLGLFIGLVIVEGFRLTSVSRIIVPIFTAAVFAALGYKIYRSGVFLVAFATGFYVVRSMVTGIDKSLILIIGVAVGLAIAVLCMVLMRPMIIVASSFTGALTFALILCENLIEIRWSADAQRLVPVIIGLVIGLIGLIYQFRTTSK